MRPNKIYLFRISSTYSKFYLVKNYSKILKKNFSIKYFIPFLYGKNTKIGQNIHIQFFKFQIKIGEVFCKGLENTSYVVIKPNVKIANFFSKNIQFKTALKEFEKWSNVFK